MVDQPYRIAIVGASSLIGKELIEALSESSLGGASFTLLDEEKVAGQVTAAGDEIAFVQQIGDGSFDGMDLVFFAGEAEVTRKYWKQARSASANIVDLSYTLANLAKARVAAPLLKDKPAGDPPHGNPSDAAVGIVEAADPAALLLTLIANRLQSRFEVRNISATLLMPASQFGSAAMDELHQQTIRLLSFQSLPNEQYDAQVAFNLLLHGGDEAKIKLSEVETRISSHCRSLSTRGSGTMALQALHAPVFHSYGASIFIDLVDPVQIGDVENALSGSYLDVLSGKVEAPNNVNVTGHDAIKILVRSQDPAENPSSSFRLWATMDNMKLGSLNAVACGMELLGLRSARHVN